MTSQPEKQTIAIYILPNISKSKCNKTMKLCRLIEYSIENFILKNHTHGEETIARPFSKKSELSLSLYQ